MTENGKEDRKIDGERVGPQMVFMVCVIADSEDKH